MLKKGQKLGQIGGGHESTLELKNKNLSKIEGSDESTLVLKKGKNLKEMGCSYDFQIWKTIPLRSIF